MEMKNPNANKTANAIKKPMHQGHRKRTRNQAMEIGLEKFTDIQQVEFMLYYIVPRKDTNPLAHRLLDRFKSFSNILDARPEELELIEGLNTTTANKICGMRQIINLYQTKRITGSISIKNDNMFLNYLESLLRFQSTEILYVFAITNNYKIKAYRTYQLKQVRTVGIQVQEFYGFLNATNPAFVAVAHNHPDGCANSSDDGKAAASYIKKLLFVYNIELLDSFVVGEDGIYSENQKGYLRNFSEIEYLNYLD